MGGDIWSLVPDTSWKLFAFITCKIVSLIEKTEEINEKEAGNCPFFKKTCALVVCTRRRCVDASVEKGLQEVIIIKRDHFCHNQWSRRRQQKFSLSQIQQKILLKGRTKVSFLKEFCLFSFFSNSLVVIVFGFFSDDPNPNSNPTKDYLQHTFRKRSKKKRK